MNLWHEVFDDLTEIQQDIGKEPTIDQRLQIAQIRALLSIGQELSALNPQNTTYRDAQGNTRNGWGLETHER